MTKTVMIDGMCCKHCAASVKKHLEALDGVSATVDLEGGSASVTMTTEHTDDELKQAIEDAGFEMKSVA